MTRRTRKSNGFRKAAAQPSRVQKGSGNVFADLGLPHPEQELLKAQLTLQIYRLIRQLGITQAEAGKVLGIKQPHVSALMRNRAGLFSVERLMEFLTALGQDVEITVRPARKPQGAVSVTALRREEYFRERGRRADRAETLRILEHAGKGNAPVADDELPAEWRKKPGRKATNGRESVSKRGQKRRADSR